MKKCCICGSDIGAEHNEMLVNGKPVPVCGACGEILDAAEPLDKKDPKREELYQRIQEKLKNSGAAPAVVEAVKGIFIKDDPQSAEESAETEELPAEQEAEETTDTSSESFIENWCGFLSVFAVVFLITGIVLSLVIGIPLTRVEPASGWTVVVAGVLGSVFTFAVIMLTLNVASTVVKISRKLDETSEKVAAADEKLDQIANMVTAKRQK